MVTIAPACKATLPSILALLPGAVDHRASHWAALADGEVVGAASCLWLGVHNPPGFAGQLFVRPAWRRRGIGRALVDAMATAATGETDGLWSLDRHADDSDAAAFLAHVGFAPAQRDLHFRMSMSGFLAHMDAIVTRLRKAGRIPANATTPTLREAPLDHTAMLVADQFRQPPARVRQRLELALVDPATANLDPDVSTVVIENGRVVGTLLTAIVDDAAHIDCNIVAQDRRRSWVNALQLHTATSRALSRAAHIDFHCDEAVRDSVNLARRAGGILQFSAARYGRAA